MPTDVLSFPLYDENGRLDDEELGILLERPVSRQIVRAQRGEGCVLTVHSVLHLLGYDHEPDETEMFEKQREIMEIILAKLHE